MELPLCHVCTEMFNAIAETSLPPDDQNLLCEGPYHHSTAATRRAAAEGCGICLKVEDCLVEHQNNDVPKGDARGAFRVELWGRYRTGSTSSRSNDHAFIMIAITCPWAWFDFEAVRRLPTTSAVLGEDIWKDVFRMFCFSVPPSGGFSLSALASPEVDHRKLAVSVAGHTGGPMTLDLAKKWLNECVQTHTSCGKTGRKYMLPPRLLCLSNSSVHLVETSITKPLVQGYIALSHCWGKPSLTLKLTASNKKFFCDNIPTDSLPRTFRDAIVICRALGFDWLWIDSLCILQSDAMDIGDRQHIVDWSSHVGTMDQIYQNSALNIAAAASVDTETGCFQDRRNGVQYQPCIRAVPNFRAAQDGRRTGMESCLIASNRFAIRGAEFSCQNLDYRGWVAQERLLSRRTIHWARDQVFWECSEVPLASEILPIGVTDRGFFADNYYFPYNWKSKEPDKQHYVWLQILEGYTRRRLTRSEDMLPAIAGVASKTGSALDDTYLAGHFKSYLAISLLWSTRNYRYARSIVCHPYRAPSWSWASMEGSIHWDYQEKRDLVAASILKKAYVEPIEPLNPYGQVSSGFLELYGPVSALSDTMRFDHEIKAWPGSLRSRSVLINIDTYPAWFERNSWSDPLYAFDWSCAILLLILRSRLGNEASLVEEMGLILAPAHHKDVGQQTSSVSPRYMRMGTFEGTGGGPEFEGYTEKNVIIE